MRALRPNENRARNAVIMIWIVATVSLGSIVSEVFTIDLLHRINEGNFTQEEAEMNDSRTQIIGVVYVIVLIISYVTFIQWFRRAYYNLHSRIDGLEYSEGWAAGSWFVPFMNLVRPYRIMRELYQETQLELERRRVVESLELTTTAVGWWWAVWIIGSLLSRISSRITLKAEAIDEIILATKFSIFSDLMLIPAAILAVKVISDYSRFETLLYETDGKEPMTEEIQEHYEPEIIPDPLTDQTSV